MRLASILSESWVSDFHGPLIRQLARVGSFHTSSDFLVGKTKDGKYKVAIKAFTEPSSYGINGGMVSKLFVYPADAESGLSSRLAAYERGWDVKPTDPEVKKLVKDVLAVFPDFVEPADVDPKSKFEEDSMKLATVLGIGNSTGLRLAAVVEGRQVLEDDGIQDMLYSKEFRVAVTAMEKKLAGGWSFSIDSMSGTFEWTKEKGWGKKSGYYFYATPNWDGAKDTPVNVMNPDGDDIGEERIAFSLDSKKSPDANAAFYVAKVVVPTINKIEAGKYESVGPKKLAAALEDMTPEIGNKTKRPDLGAYGQRQGKKKQEGCKRHGMEAVKGLRDAIARAEEDMTHDIGAKMKRPDLGAYGGQRKREEAVEWVQLTKRTEDPKLAWLEKQLKKMGILSRREGTSFHAPILKVPKNKFNAADDFLATVDDIPDDDPQFEAVKAGPQKLNQVLQAETDADLDTADQDSQAPGPMRREVPAVRKNVKPVSRLSVLVGESEIPAGSRMDKAVKTLVRELDSGKYWEDEIITVAKKFGVDMDELEMAFKMITGEQPSEYVKESVSDDVDKLMVNDPDFSDWYGEVVDAVEEEFESDHSDAFGIVSGFPQVVLQCWKKKMSVKDTVAELDKASAAVKKEEGVSRKGVGAVKALRACIAKAEEDMTPEIGKKMKRPDLGKYGGKKVEGVDSGDTYSDENKWRDAAKAAGATTFDTSYPDADPFDIVALTPAKKVVGWWDGDAKLGTTGGKLIPKKEGQSISFKNKDSFKSLYDRGEVHTATDNAAFTRKPAFDTLAADVEVSDNPEGTVTFRSKDGKKFISIDQHPEKAYGYKKEEDDSDPDPGFDPDKKIILKNGRVGADSTPTVLSFMKLRPGDRMTDLEIKKAKQHGWHVVISKEEEAEGWAAVVGKINALKPGESTSFKRKSGLNVTVKNASVGKGTPVYEIEREVAPGKVEKGHLAQKDVAATVRDLLSESKLGSKLSGCIAKAEDSLKKTKEKAKDKTMRGVAEGEYVHLLNVTRKGDKFTAVAHGISGEGKTAKEAMSMWAKQWAKKFKTAGEEVHVKSLGLSNITGASEVEYVF